MDTNELEKLGRLQFTAEEVEVILELEKPLADNDAAFMAWQRGLLKAQIAAREQLYEQAMAGKNTQSVIAFMRLFDTVEVIHAPEQ